MDVDNMQLDMQPALRFGSSTPLKLLGHERAALTGRFDRQLGCYQHLFLGYNNPDKKSNNATYNKTCATLNFYFWSLQKINKMKLISGNYGLGKVKLTDNGFIISRTGRELPFSSIKAIESKVRKNKEQSIGSVLIGLIIITPILFLLFNIIGLAIGIILSFSGSYYTTKSYSAEITFNDNTKLKVECNRWQMNTLSDLSQTT